MSAPPTSPGPAQRRLQIELWSDLCSPRSYLAKRRWELAAQQFEHPSEVLVRHRSFRLDPARVRGDHVSEREWWCGEYGEGSPAARERAEQLVTEALEVGLVIDLDRAVHTATLDAHRLCHLGVEQGGPAQQAAVLERLFAARFAEGRALDDVDTLQRLGAEAGLDEVQLASVLAGDAYAAAVRTDEESGRGHGLADVPAAVVNGGQVVEGAPPVEALVAQLQQAWRALGSSGTQSAAGSVSSSN